MKQLHHITQVGAQTTFGEVWQWGQQLERLHARIAPRFARPEPRRRVLAYLKGIVSAVWEADLVRDDLQTYILEQLGDPHAVLVIDETSVHKRDKKSAGVAKQHCGATGQLENSQVGVFLAYVSSQGHTLLDREWYLLVGGESISNSRCSDWFSLEEVTGYILLLRVGGSIGSSIHCYKSILHLYPWPSAHNRCVSPVY